jgi:hypothetical protein
VNLTIPLQTLTDLADRPGELGGIGPVDPWLARDLARAAASHPKTSWCVTVTDDQGHAIGHGCARPQRPKRPQQPQPRIKRKRPRQDPRDGPSPDTGNTVSTVSTANTGSTGSTENTVSTGLALTATGQPGPPGGFGTWRLSTGIPGQPDLVVALEPVAIGDCDHRHETKGHDPGITLRHLTQIRHATCTAPGCRRPAAQCDFDHSVPYEAGGRTCA